MVNHKLPPGFHLVVLDTVDSTNVEARRRAEADAPDGTLIQALTQTQGRGRRGRRWESPEGNLYMSLILKPDCSVVHGLSITFVSAIAMYEAVSVAVERARAGQGPSLVEGRTYRYEDHSLGLGRIVRDPYRDQEEVEEWKLTIKTTITWYDLKRDEVLFEKKMTAFIEQKNSFF